MKIITCIFGKKFQRLHPAVSNECIVYSNNKNLAQEAHKKGWKFEFIDLPLSDDDVISSLQSKFIKFMQFNYDKNTEYLYHDHKIIITEDLVNKVKSNKSNKSIFVTFTPNKDRTVHKEFLIGLKQKRYSQAKDKTLDFLNEMEINEYSCNTAVMRTGLIYYKKVDDRVKHFLDLVYNSCKKLNNPHCQIFWGLYAQKFENLIDVVPLENLGYKRITNL